MVLRCLGTAVALLTLLSSLPAAAATYRYAASSNRIYVTGAGVVTLSRIKARLPTAPLEKVGRDVWLLGANLQLERGAVLQLHGATAGGDVDELRLRSDNDASPTAYVWISADYGGIDLQSTRVISWDRAAGGPDTESAQFGRAFIRVRSSLAADGATPQESRMDILDSEVGWLGFDAAESYGLSWKVVGDGDERFERVQVRGNVVGSRLHHNFHGSYSVGHTAGLWRDDEVDHCVGSGIVVQAGSADALIESSRFHDNGAAGIAIASAPRATVRGNDLGTQSLTVSGATGVAISANRLDAPVTISGDATLGSDVRFSEQPRVDLVLDTHSIARFFDADHAAFDIEPDADVPSRVGPGGSEMQLDGRSIGGATRVFTRALQSFPAGGATLRVTPATWNTTDATEARDWIVTADRKLWRARFVVGDLTPGALFVVRTGNVPLLLRADATGHVDFPAIATGAGPVGFSVLRLAR